MYTHAWEPLEKGKSARRRPLIKAPPRCELSCCALRVNAISSFFWKSDMSPRPRHATDLNLKILIPAYILSELKAGFQIGAVLFLPFLVIDIAVASVTLSIGMMQLPPAMVSAPFKILLFVLVDGWNLVIGSLMKTFLGSRRPAAVSRAAVLFRRWLSRSSTPFIREF